MRREKVEGAILIRAEHEGVIAPQPLILAEISTRPVLIVPALLCGCMALVGAAIGAVAQVGGLALVLSYVATGMAFTMIAALIFIFTEAVKLALRRANKPLHILVGLLRDRLPLMVLPAFMFPLLLAGYTTAKIAIPTIVGFTWDRFWADADRLVFGQDAWILSIPLVEWAPIPIWEWVYSAGWGLVLFIWLAAVPLYAPKKRVGVMYTATFAAWFFGGWLVAYASSAAGPVFAHMVDPALTERFLPMRQHLADSLSPDGPIRRTQDVLATVLERNVTLPAAGISAMPSMHLAMTTIYVIAAHRSWWIVPASAFWLIIFIGSAYFGYHYWLDGIVAAVIAALCWQAAKLVFERSEFGRPFIVRHPETQESLVR